MKVLVFVKATPNSEQGISPTHELPRLLEDMGKFNDQLVKAGIMKEGDGLRPSSAGKRVTFTDQGFSSVIDGPFVETKELVAGYWVWEVKSMDEAVAWAKRCPNPMPGEEGVLELRPTNSLEDILAMMTPEQRAHFAKPQAKPRRKRKAPRKLNEKSKQKSPRRARPARARAKK